jgi:two-component system, chemotaxis family, response regulator Rcp1
MSEQVRARAIEILLVEDNPGDVRLIQEALREGKVWNNPHVVGDGEAALEFLFRKGAFTAAPRPDLVLLDLNLPKKDGREVLATVKAHPDLRRIPVVVLTSSKEEQDILRAYNLAANCYVTKPVEFDEFMKVIRMIEEFWLTIVALPIR